MHAAVVELDALADADGPAADDHRLASVPGDGLVLLLVGGVEVGGGGIELGGAGVHHLVDRPDVPVVAQLPYLLGEAVCQRAYLLVGEAEPFCPPQQFRSERLGEQLLFHIYNVL